MPLTVDEVLESFEKNKNKIMFRLNTKRRKNPHHITKSDGYRGNASYFSLEFLNASGDWIYPDLKLTSQIIGSKAKLPRDNPEDAKFMSISFMKMDRDKIEGGDFVRDNYPKDATPAKKQSIDNKFDKKISTLESNNKKLYEVFGLISDAFVRFFEKEKLKYKKHKYIKDGKVNKAFQDTADIDGETINLLSKIFRVQIPICRHNSNHPDTEKYKDKIGFYNYTEKRLDPIIFSKNKKDEWKEAKYKKKGKKLSLNVENVDRIITYKSIITANINFGDVTCSGQGAYLKFKLRKMFIRTHKSDTTKDFQTPEELAEMDDFDGFKKIDSDSDSETDMPDAEEIEKAQKAKKAKKIQSDTSDSNDSDTSDKSQKSSRKSSKKMQDADSDVDSEPDEYDSDSDSNNECDDSDNSDDKPKVKKPKKSKKK